MIKEEKVLQAQEDKTQKIKDIENKAIRDAKQERPDTNTILTNDNVENPESRQKGNLL